MKRPELTKIAETHKKNIKMSQNELLKPNNDVKALCDIELANFH